LKRNLIALVIANCLFGLSFGVYDLAFPLLLSDIGASTITIGQVLAVAGVINFLIIGSCL
jgi:MFS family permease